MRTRTREKTRRERKRKTRTRDSEGVTTGNNRTYSGGASSIDETRDTRSQNSSSQNSNRRSKQTTTSGGVGSVRFKVSLNGHDEEVVDRDKSKKDN